VGNLEGMLVVDQRGDIRMCSGSLARRIGRAAAGLTGQPVWSLLPRHAAGDAVLQAVAARLRGCVRAADTVARLGGDEFGLILAGAATRESAARVLDSVLASGSMPVGLEERAVPATLSIGACVFPGGGSGSEDLRRHADRAMYRAKRAGGNTLRFHRQALVRLAPRAAPDA